MGRLRRVVSRDSMLLAVSLYKRIHPEERISPLGSRVFLSFRRGSGLEARGGSVDYCA